MFRPRRHRESNQIGFPSEEGRQRAIDDYAYEVSELVSIDENGKYCPGALTFAWVRADGSTAMMGVLPRQASDQASLPDPDVLAGLATGGRAAVITNLGSAEGEPEAPPEGRVEHYEVVALAGPFRDPDGTREKLAAFELVRSSNPGPLELEALDENRARGLIDAYLPLLRALTSGVSGTSPRE